MRNKLLIATSIFALLTGLGVNAYPGETVCAFTSKKDDFSSPQKQLLQDAKGRIEAKFGLMQSEPVIVFFEKQDSFWLLQLNEYGSASFLGPKTCVIIGPKGQNVDVVAHELMHAETKHRVGYWRRWIELPIWFDEGLAMQVDHRERYNLPKDAKTSYVRKLHSVSEFSVPDRDLLTNHYASAKSEVALWVSKVGTDSVYIHLNSIKEGVPFEAVWLSTETELTNPSSGHNR